MRHFNTSLIVLLGILTACAATAPVAAEAPPPADLGALLREAQEKSPAILAAAARFEASGRAPSQAGALPDPEASVAYTNDGLSGFTLGEREFSTLRLSWTQEVPYPGKRDRASQAAAFVAERMAKELERVRLQVGAAVKSAYADLYRLDRTAAILEENRSVLESFAQAARRRYEVGEGIQQSILKAHTEILRLEAELTQVAQERRAAELRLNAAAGRATDLRIGPATVLPEAALPGDRAALVDDALAACPEVGALRAAVRQREAGLQLARLNLKPDFIWSAAYDYREDLDPMVMGTFGLRLPAYRQRKQVQAVAEAEFELMAARRDLEDRQVRLRAEIGETLSRAEKAERLLMLFGQGIVPQARRTLESARASYGVGKIGMLDLLSDLTVILNSEVEYAALEAERFQVLADLEPLLGRELIQAQASGPAGAAGGSGGGAAGSGGAHE
jgi:outer membrane protein TolC